LAGQEQNPKPKDALSARWDDDDMSVYDEDPPPAQSSATGTPTGSFSAQGDESQSGLKKKIKEQDQTLTLPPDAQDNYFEKREPSELFFCIILAAMYAGLAKYLAQNLWETTQITGQWDRFVSVEGFFITLGLLSLALGLRPYLNPSSLQISNTGIKYCGPYWPQRKSITWAQMFKMWLSPDMVIILYHPAHKPRGMRLLIIQCNYLSDNKQLLSRFARYTPVPPIYLKAPDWYLKAIFLIGYLTIVCWILYMIRG